VNLAFSPRRVRSNGPIEIGDDFEESSQDYFPMSLKQ